MTEKTHKPLLVDSVKAAVDIEKFRFIGFDGNYCSANAKALGISDVETEQGQYAPVALNGILLVAAAGSITVGSKVASSDGGYAITYTTGEFNGYALDASPGGGLVKIIRIAKGI